MVRRSGASPHVRFGQNGLMGSDPRAVLAVLANDTTRRVYAARVLGLDFDVPPAKARRTVETLTAAGLLDASGAATGDVFRAFLGGSAKPAGAARFVAGGRITRIPRSPVERRELFALVIDRVIAPDEVLDEAEVSARIAELHDDVTALRRDLVDAAFLTRTSTGSEYRRGPAAA